MDKTIKTNLVFQNFFRLVAKFDYKNLRAYKPVQFVLTGTSLIKVVVAFSFYCYRIVSDYSKKKWENDSLDIVRTRTRDGSTLGFGGFVLAFVILSISALVASLVSASASFSALDDVLEIDQFLLLRYYALHLEVVVQLSLKELS